MNHVGTAALACPAERNSAIFAHPIREARASCQGTRDRLQENESPVAIRG